jgi:hypothetical protein
VIDVTVVLYGTVTDPKDGTVRYQMQAISFKSGLGPEKKLWERLCRSDTHCRMAETKPYADWTLEELHKALFRSPGKEANRQILHKIVSEFPGAAEIDQTQVEKVIALLCEDPKEEEKRLTLRQLAERLFAEGIKAGVSQQALFEFIAHQAQKHHA